MHEITLPWPAKELHSNSRPNKFALARAKKKARGEAMLVAKGAKIPTIPDAVLEFTYYPPHRRYDVHNIPHSLKAYIDGIADAMGCDDKGFRVKYPSEFAEVRKPADIVVKIYPRTAYVPVIGTIS